MQKFAMEKLILAQLMESYEYGTFWGIKNMIGVIVEFSNKKYFYSIFDDCFFNIGPLESSNWKVNELFAYPLDKKYGKELKESWKDDGINIDLISKEELIDSKTMLTGYFSDLDYEDLKRTTDVEDLNFAFLNKYLIRTEIEYEEILDRPVSYVDDNYKINTRKRTK